jgi:hypothetical protein
LPVLLLQISRSNNFLVSFAGKLLNANGYVVSQMMVFRLAFFQKLTTFHLVALLINMRCGAAYPVLWVPEKIRLFQLV